MTLSYVLMKKIVNDLFDLHPGTMKLYPPHYINTEILYVNVAGIKRSNDVFIEFIDAKLSSFV